MTMVIPKNRNQTSQKILNAFDEIVKEWGWQGASINRISEKAGVSKVLIYRYFGGLDGLIGDYIKMGGIFPAIGPETVSQLYPLRKSDLARIWYRSIRQLYRTFRTSKAARELLKATLVENDRLADVASTAIDEELTRFVDQLSFVKGADTEAISAVILGGMSYLTIMAQNNRTVVGLDLRSEKDWHRVEQSLKLVCIALNQLTIDTKEITLPNPPVVLGQWHESKKR